MTWGKSSFSNGCGHCVEITRSPWVKSSFSGGGPCCVEIGHRIDVVLVRDSKYPDNGYLVFPVEEFAALVNGIKSGEFDNLV